MQYIKGNVWVWHHPQTEFTNSMKTGRQEQNIQQLTIQVAGKWHTCTYINIKNTCYMYLHVPGEFWYTM